jgi:hypothetical protein
VKGDTKKYEERGNKNSVFLFLSIHLTMLFHIKPSGLIPIKSGIMDLIDSW